MALYCIEMLFLNLSFFTTVCYFVDMVHIFGILREPITSSMPFENCYIFCAFHLEWYSQIQSIGARYSPLLRFSNLIFDVNNRFALQISHIFFSYTALFRIFARSIKSHKVPSKECR